VVSNSAFPRLQRSVERAGLLPLTGAHLYSAEDVGRPKPAPDAYLHAAHQLGLHPRHCLVIEDSLTGVRAARAAGMRVLGFLGGSHIRAGHATLLTEAGAMDVFTEMRELPGLIASAELGPADSVAPGLGAPV
jgi:beta-phosphoglucomutase-like phosphatase (HAD superfamily)